MMNKLIKKLKTNAGMTLFEMLVSIIVASMVMTMLMSILTMVITNKAALDVKNRLTNQSYIMSETIQSNLFDKNAQEIVITQNDSSAIIIEFRHTRDIIINGNILADPDYVDLNPDILKYDIINGEITYNDVLLHDQEVEILPGSNLEAISIDGSCDFVNTICSEGVIKITVIMSLNFKSDRIESRTFITTFII